MLQTVDGAVMLIQLFKELLTLGLKQFVGFGKLDVGLMKPFVFPPQAGEFENRIVRIFLDHVPCYTSPSVQYKALLSSSIIL